MKPSEVDPGFGDQGDKPRDKVHRLEDDVRGAIAVRRFELVAHTAIAARVPQVIDISAHLFVRHEALVCLQV